MILKLIWILTLVCTLPSLSWAGGRVGTGGNPVRSFLETTLEKATIVAKLINEGRVRHFQFCETILLRVQEPDDRTSEEFRDKVQACTELLESVSRQIVALQAREEPITLELWDSVANGPLTVEWEPGQFIVVIAKTPLGTDGPIQFDEHRVGSLSPSRLFELVFHEFSHKTRFQGQFLSDIHPMNNGFRLGRHLIDAVASTATEIALAHNMLSSEFVVQDLFQCEGKVGHKDRQFDKSTTRFYESSTPYEKFRRYRTGFGFAQRSKNAIHIFHNGAEYVLVLEVHEEDACKKETNLPRWSRLTLYEGSKQDPKQVAAEQRIDENLLCPANPDEPPQLKIQFDRIEFECRFLEEEVL